MGGHKTRPKNEGRPIHRNRHAPTNYFHSSAKHNVLFVISIITIMKPCLSSIAIRNPRTVTFLTYSTDYDLGNLRVNTIVWSYRHNY